MTNKMIRYRLLESGDVPALQTLLERCYGDSYFDALYYDGDALSSAIKEKRLRSCIALNEAGEIVAHLGMRHPNGSLTSDSSLAIVDPRYRAQGLLIETGVRLSQTCLEMGLCGIYGQAVTVHTYTQQSNLKGGAGVSGIYLNYIPAGQRFLESEQAQSNCPTPAVLMLTILSQAPIRSCYIPEQYATQIHEAFNSCKMQRDLLVSTPPLPLQSLIEKSYKPLQRVCYFWAEKLGADLLDQIKEQIRALKSHPINAFYIHLPLDQGELDEHITQLRHAGFFYAGLLPEYSQRDWLILQFITGPEPDWTSVQLSGERTNALLQFILDDRQVVQQLSES